MRRYFFNLFVYLLFVISGDSLAQSGSANVPFLANFNAYSSTGYNDCWGYTAPDGREYALLGVKNGTSIIDITDPSNLTEITFIPSSNSIWKDIKTYQHYAYVVNETGGGIQIIDLSNLPTSATLVNTYSGISASHNIYIDEANAILYSEGTSSDPVIVLSLADPVNLTQLSTLGIECHDIFALNQILFVSEGTSGSVGIYDMSIPGSPSLLQRHNIPSAGYVHNAWATEDGNYLMTTEETSGKTIKLWDISDVSNISLTDEILGPSGLAHNAHIKGNYSYVSHYGDGLRIYDISDPYNIFEAGYYDTYPAPGSGFEGAWGAFPFFRSGKVLISDQSTGLYVVYFEGAVDADSLDPKSVTDITAYSDYLTPNEIYISWTDPTSLINGDPISPSDFSINIYRSDTLLVGTVPGGDQSFTDTGLMDGTEYSYRLVTKLNQNDSLSLDVTISWTAGGSPVPSAPASIYILNNSSPYILKWINPVTNIDGTPLDDFAGVHLYEDGVFKTTFSRTSADSGKLDSASFTASGLHEYFLVAFDNENPVNESDPSNFAYQPISLPIFDSFPTNSVVNTAYWINSNAEVNNVGVNPPSTPYVLSLDGHPAGGDVVESLPVNLSGLNSDQIILSYWYQPQGNGNAPESGDELYLDFMNNQGEWVNIRTYPGSGLTNFSNESIDVMNENAGIGATFVFPAFQFRFRNTGTADAVQHYDHWLIDDVSLDVILSGVEPNHSLPTQYGISPNFPNPFNPSTNITFELPQTSDVTLIVYNLLGQKIKTLAEGNLNAGSHTISWDGTNEKNLQVTSGVYIYEFRAGNQSSDAGQFFIKTRKMILMR